MGIKVTFDGINKIIQVDLAPVGGEVTIDVAADLYSDMKEDWISDPILNRLRTPIKVIGGQPTSGSDKAGDIYFLDPAWKIRPYEGDHRLILNGSLFSDDGTSVFTFTVGTFQVLTEMVVASIVTKTSTGGSGASAAELWNYGTRGLTEQVSIIPQNILDISTQVWTEATRTLTSASGPTAAQISAAVWAEVSRTLTEAAGLTPTQSLQLADIHGSVLREVFVDTEHAINGNGYQQTPFNNWSDAVDYAEDNELKDLVLLADATVDRQLKNFVIRGIGVPSLDLNGQIMTNTVIERCVLTGSYTGRIQATECAVINLGNMAGVFLTCSMAGTMTVAPGSDLLISRVAPALAAQPWTLSMNSGQASIAAIHNSSGGMIVTNMDHADDVLHFNGSQGEITFDASCVAGSAVCVGNIRVDDSLSATAVDKSRIVSSLILGVEEFP